MQGCQLLSVNGYKMILWLTEYRSSVRLSPSAWGLTKVMFDLWFITICPKVLKASIRKLGAVDVTDYHARRYYITIFRILSHYVSLSMRVDNGR